jgi:hypothetical protein
MLHLHRFVFHVTGGVWIHFIALQREFERLGKVCFADDVKLPSKRALEKKAAQMSKLITQPVTEV